MTDRESFRTRISERQHEAEAAFVRGDALQLFDSSVVTHPAYPTTDAQVRSTLTGVGLDFDGASLCRQPRSPSCGRRSLASTS